MDLRNFVLYMVVLVGAAVTRIGLLDQAPIYDEYFHLLAAENWLRNGELAILDGTYARAALYTKLVAASFATLGETSWSAARIFPSLVSAVALILLVTIWVRHNVGMVGAIVCAFFLLLSPIGIETAQFVRFYSLQGLLFVAGALAVYSSLTLKHLGFAARSAFWGFSGVAFVMAMQLQLITAVGLGGVFAWILLFFVVPWAMSSLRQAAVLAGMIGLAIVGFFVLGLNELAGKLWNVYQTAPPDWVRDTFYYHRNLRDSYPTFWPLFPLACLVALVAASRLAAFCALIFGGSVVVLSLGIRNDMKYLYHALPFFFIIWAIFFEQSYNKLRDFLVTQSQELTRPLPNAVLRSSVFAVLIAGILGFSILANAAFLRSARLIAGSSGGTLFEENRRTWPEAADLVSEWVEKGAIIVTSHPILAAAYIGDYDIAYNRTHFHDNEKTLPEAVRQTKPVFVTDMRDGRPVIASVDAMIRVMRCTATGVAVFPSPIRGVNFEHLFFVTARDLEITLTPREGHNMSLIAWENPSPLAKDACTDLPIPTDGGASERLRAGISRPSEVNAGNT